MNKELQESVLYKKRHETDENGDLLRFILVWLIVLALFLNAMTLLTSNFGWVTVDGSSMYKTLQNGDNLLTKKVANADGLQHGDIIVVYVGDYEECKDVTGKYLIKRLIGKAGDKVKCVDEQVYICYAGTQEWVELNEPYAYYGNSHDIYDFEEYTVGEGEIFFLGDNREYSRDSRYYEWAEGKCHLKDRLYKSEDVVSVVPKWALGKSAFFEKIFSFQQKMTKFRENIVKF